MVTRRVLKAQKNNLLPKLAAAFQKRFPDLVAVAFFGSQVAGEPDEQSDYDVLLVLPEGLEWHERWRAAGELGQQFGVRLDVTATSPRAVRFHASLYPWFNLWMREAVVFGDTSVLNGDIPPVAKQGYEDSLRDVEIWLEDVDTDMTLSEQAHILYRALRQTLIVEASITDQTSHARLKQRLIELLGPDWVARWRQPRRRVTRSQVERLTHVVQQTLAQVRAQVETMSPNDSDAYLDSLKIIRSDMRQNYSVRSIARLSR